MVAHNVIDRWRVHGIQNWSKYWALRHAARNSSRWRCMRLPNVDSLLTISEKGTQPMKHSLSDIEVYYQPFEQNLMIDRVESCWEVEHRHDRDLPVVHSRQNVIGDAIECRLCWMKTSLGTLIGIECRLAIHVTLQLFKNNPFQCLAKKSQVRDRSIVGIDCFIKTWLLDQWSDSCTLE